jgi:regulatory protein
MAKKQKPLKRTPLKRTPLKRKEYNPEDFKNKEYKPLKRTPLKPKEYNPEDYKNKEYNPEDSKKEYKPKTYKKKEYKVKDYRELKAREPKPFVQLTPKEAFLKLAAFCAYQERCYQEIYAKLEEWKIDESDHYAIVTLLEEEKFLNEKRFAESYTRGKFGYKKWGKLKIRYGLLQKDISENMIQDAFFSEIEDKEYFTTLTELLEKKWSELEEKEDDNFKRIVKATNYALQKGYESELIREILNDINKPQN